MNGPLTDPPSFRTKTGRCEVTPERLALTRGGRRGALSKLLFGRERSPSLIYGALCLLGLPIAAWAWLRPDPALAVMAATASAMFGGFAFVGRGFSSTSTIDRAETTSVVAHPPRPPKTRGYMDVRFERGGRAQRRLILLPGSWSGGEAEYPRAVGLLRDAGWAPEE